jgi:hypothetical protein
MSGGADKDLKKEKKRARRTLSTALPVRCS